MNWWKFWQEEENQGEDPDYYEEGVSLVEQERYHEALTSFRLALRERPDAAEPLEQMGVVYTRIGVTDEAIKAYRKALDRDPDSAGAHYGLGFLMLRRGRESEAERHLEAFLESASGGEAEARHVRHARETLEQLRGAADGDERATEGEEDRDG